MTTYVNETKYKNYKNLFEKVKKNSKRSITADFNTNQILKKHGKLLKKLSGRVN